MVEIDFFKPPSPAASPGGGRGFDRDSVEKLVDPLSSLSHMFWVLHRSIMPHFRPELRQPTREFFPSAARMISPIVISEGRRARMNPPRATHAFTRSSAGGKELLQVELRYVLLPGYVPEGNRIPVGCLCQAHERHDGVPASGGDLHGFDPTGGGPPVLEFFGFRPAVLQRPHLFGQAF